VSYKVIVADNFHYQDETEEYTAGVYATAEEALSEAKRIVDVSLRECVKPGLTADGLYDLYTMFGNDPYIVASDESAELSFSAWDYARTRAGEILAAMARKSVAEG